MTVQGCWKRKSFYIGFEPAILWYVPWNSFVLHTQLYAKIRVLLLDKSPSFLSWVAEKDKVVVQAFLLLKTHALLKDFLKFAIMSLIISAVEAYQT